MFFFPFCWKAVFLFLISQEIGHCFLQDTTLNASNSYIEQIDLKSNFFGENAKLQTSVDAIAEENDSALKIIATTPLVESFGLQDINILAKETDYNKLNNNFDSNKFKEVNALDNGVDAFNIPTNFVEDIQPLDKGSTDFEVLPDSNDYLLQQDNAQSLKNFANKEQKYLGKNKNEFEENAIEKSKANKDYKENALEESTANEGYKENTEINLDNIVKQVLQHMALSKTETNKNQENLQTQNIVFNSTSIIYLTKTVSVSMFIEPTSSVDSLPSKTQTSLYQEQIFKNKENILDTLRTTSILKTTSLMPETATTNSHKPLLPTGSTQQQTSIAKEKTLDNKNGENNKKTNKINLSTSTDLQPNMKPSLPASGKEEHNLKGNKLSSVFKKAQQLFKPLISSTGKLSKYNKQESVKTSKEKLFSTYFGKRSIDYEDGDSEDLMSFDSINKEEPEKNVSNRKHQNKGLALYNNCNSMLGATISIVMLTLFM